jgi:death-on-curing protein
VPPRPEPRWVDSLVVEAVHLDLVRAHGGLPGLRDEHALEASLARARQRRAYDDAADVAALAAEYGFGLARNHPFHDGNKRVAFVTMGVFLGLNGYEMEAPEADVVTVMLNLAGGELSQDEMAEWIRSHLKKLGG